MPTTEFNKLVRMYGEAKAKKAAEWFGQFSPAFRAAVWQAAYCEANEYLWF